MSASEISELSYRNEFVVVMLVIGHIINSYR